MKNSEKNKNKRKTLSVLLALIIVCFCALLGAAEYIKLSDRSVALEQELSCVNMELELRSFAAEEKTAAESRNTENAAAEQKNRETLMNAFLERDREELLMLVNPWNPLPEEYEPRLVDIGDDKLVDERCAGALEQMLADCKASYDRAPVPISAYRTQEYQQGLFENKIERLLQAGYGADVVYAEAAKEVAVPGTSEHQLGLAVDIIDEYYTELDYYQMYTNTQKWLMEHCSEYGFILRYPEDSSDITGIIYEPWHYRYVGRAIAKEITAAGITLEEYLEQLN